MFTYVASGLYGCENELYNLHNVNAFNMDRMIKMTSICLQKQHFYYRSSDTQSITPHYLF